MDRVLFAPRTLPALRPDVAEDPRPYDSWLRKSEAARTAGDLNGRTQSRPLHVLMVLDGAPPPETADSLHSLARQRSNLWRLTVAAAEPWHRQVSALLDRSGIRSDVDLVTPRHVSGQEDTLEVGLAAAAGDDVALFFAGDVWTVDTIEILSAALPADGVAYADEDCVGFDGSHRCPRLKPDFSPEYLLHADVIGRPFAISAAVSAILPPPSGAARGASEHDVALRACEVAATVHHIPQVLCHRRIPPRPLPTASSQDRAHVAAALQRRDEQATVRQGRSDGTVAIRRNPRPGTVASVIIPFRDEPRFLRTCFESVEQTRGRVAHEYVLVDNGSNEPETATLLERLAARSEVRIIRDDRPFNWAELNNHAASHATGDVLVFLNNDIEATTPGWLDMLAAQAQRQDIGVVGARLLYPDGRVQHAGVVLGLGGAAGHLFVGLPERENGYMAMAVTTRECAAVTGACMTTRRDVFESHGGFDESLGVDLNDVDYCLRVQRSGLRVLYEPLAELIHYESPSRGTAGDPSDIVKFVERWKTAILSGDPYLNPHLTRLDSSCALRGPSEAETWQQWYAGLLGG